MWQEKVLTASDKKDKIVPEYTVWWSVYHGGRKRINILGQESERTISSF